LRRDDRHPRAALQQAAHLLHRDRAAADDEHAPPLEVKARHVVAVGHTPTEWSRAPWRSSRTVISAAPAAKLSENAPGPIASSETERSSWPASALSASDTSRALAVTAAPFGRRRYVASAARSPPGPYNARSRPLCRPTSSSSWSVSASSPATSPSPAVASSEASRPR